MSEFSLSETKASSSLPYSAEIEEAVLQLALMDYQYYLGDSLLEPEDFYIHKHRFVWSAILSLKRAGHNVDIVSVWDELERSNVSGAKSALEEVGGPAYLSKLLVSGADSSSVDHYVAYLHDYRARRDALLSANAIAQSAFDMTAPFDVSKQVAALQNLKWRDDQGVIREIYQVADSLKDIIDTGFHFHSTGIPDLDRVLEGGLFEGLYVSAGGPSSGKTAIWWSASQNIAKDATQSRVLFFSLEMPAEELLARTACGLVGVSWNAIRSGKRADGTPVSQQEKDSVKQVAETLGNDFAGRLVIVDKPSTIWEICRLVDLYNPDVVIIDHLNEVKRHDKTENILYFGIVASVLKNKTKQLHIPIVLIHQLNRDSSKEDRPPILTDLKYCAEIEEKADVVVMLHRPQKITVRVGAMQAQLDIYIRKFRNGTPNQMTSLVFKLQQQTFGSAPRI